MYSNIYYDTYNSVTHLWETIKGKKLYTTIDWTPFVYVPVKVDTGIKSIFGDDVTKMTFRNYKDYNNFQSQNTDMFENNVKPAIQFLTEKYHGLVDPLLPKLHVAYVDIETPHKAGFPTVELTPAEVVLIAIVDESQKRTVFGLKPYDDSGENPVNYILCDDEHDLLTRFFNWMHDEQFDAISGWNITSDSKMNKFGGFDLPYLIRRTMMIFGKSSNLYKKLSPINKVKIFKSKKIDGVYNVDIAGVTIIDYLALYKWFTTNNLESFKLGYIGETELNRGKLDYSKYKSLYDMYMKDWDLFVNYCILDSDIVMLLEKKLGYIALAQTLTSYCCVEMKNYNSSVPLIEGLFLKYFRNNGLCAPYLHGGEGTPHFPAAYVKPPQMGLHDDIVDIDITSSYPSAEITMNMSDESYFGRIIGFNNQDKMDFKTDSGIHSELHYGRPIYKMVVDHVRTKEFPPFYIMKDRGIDYYSGDKLEKFNNVVKRKLISIAPNGVIFMNQPKSTTAILLKSTFMERKKQKNLKGVYKQNAVNEPDKKDYWMEKSDNKHALQWSLKILINSFFGICSVPYSRYGSVHMAEAITSCGRYSIQSSERFVNDLFNNPNEELSDLIDEIKGLVV